MIPLLLVKRKLRLALAAPRRRGGVALSYAEARIVLDALDQIPQPELSSADRAMLRRAVDEAVRRRLGRNAA